MAKRLLISLPVCLGILTVLTFLHVNAAAAMGVGIGAGTFVSVLMDSRTESRPAWHWAIVHGVALGLMAALMMSWLR